VVGSDRATVTLNSSDMSNIIKYEIMFSPFKIVQTINGVVTIIVNDDDALRYAALNAPHNTYMDGYDQLIEGYEIGVSFTLSSDYVYGLPMRAMQTFPLQQNETYRLFNQDLPYHPYGEIDPLYGNWPYLTGHSAVMDASVTWMNSSETYVSVEPTTNSITGNNATLGSFISVGGKFEFFIFGTTSGPKANQ